MKIFHLSIVQLQEQDPAEWLETIPYFTRVVEALSLGNEVASFHCTLIRQEIQKGSVRYHFSPLAENINTIDAGKPDVIIVHGWHSIIRLYKVIHRLGDYRIFIQHHGERPFAWPKSWMQLLIDRKISGYLFSSRHIGDAWAEIGLITHSKIFEVMEVSSSFHEGSQIVMKKDDLTFLWVGRLDENKDPVTLVDGFIQFCKQNREARLKMIFQEDKLLGAVQKRIVGNETNIELIGRVPHNEIKLFYETSSFIVSTSKFEGSGVAVLEAISMGCIPILTAIPSFRKMTNDGNIGILFPVGSPEGLTNALQHAAALDLPKERQHVVDYFELNLSARAVASQIISIVGLPFRKK